MPLESQFFNVPKWSYDFYKVYVDLTFSRNMFLISTAQNVHTTISTYIFVKYYIPKQNYQNWNQVHMIFLNKVMNFQSVLLLCKNPKIKIERLTGGVHMSGGFLKRFLFLFNA